MPTSSSVRRSPSRGGSTRAVGRSRSSLRPDLAFSDGSPLRPSDVVRSWLRIIDPAQPSPLASLALDIAGAEAYLRGQNPDPGSVGAARGRRRQRPDRRPRPSGVGLPEHRRRADVRGRAARRRPGSRRARAGDGFVASGGYVLTGDAGLGAAPDGQRALLGRCSGRSRTIELVGDLGGRSEVAAFEADELDYAPISGFDAAWIAYDETLGPQLREVASLSVHVLRLRHDPSAVRRRPGAPGLRHGGRLAADRRARRGSDGSVGAGQLDGAAGHSGPERPGLPARIRPRCGARPAGGRGLPGWGRVPGDDPDDLWRRVRRGDPRGARTRARGHPDLGDDG